MTDSLTPLRFVRGSEFHRIIRGLAQECIMAVGDRALPSAGLTLAGHPRSVLERGWLQLLLGIVCMVAIANLQYGWTLFVEPIQQRFGWSNAALQITFTLFILTETWLLPVEGFLLDRFGPRLVVGLGGVLIAQAWLLNAVADSLALFYLGGVIGGIGAGMVYGSCMGGALKWFPRHRGLAAGLTAAAFGAGSALTVEPISQLINSAGYRSAFLWVGLAQGIVVLLCALFLRTPPTTADAESSVAAPAGVDFQWHETLATPAFWLMYVMMTMVAAGGLLATAQLGPMARHYQVADVPVTLFGFTLAALPFALSVDRVLNGLTRPFFGWVSDHLGRANTMFIAFSLEGLAILLLLNWAHDPTLFVLLAGLTFFAWGEIFSLFPALCGDVFGRRYAATNYGMLYTAKGTASLLVPLGGLLHEAYDSWTPVLAVAVAFDWITALLALLALKPLVRRCLAQRTQDRP